MKFSGNSRPHVIADLLFLKAAFELWPIRTWFSPMQRVFYQFQRLHDAERKTKGQLNIVRSRAQLNHSPFSLPSVQAVLAVEGLSCLENKIGTVDHFYDAGIRVL